jgi:hypothetical protein
MIPKHPPGPPMTLGNMRERPYRSGDHGRIKVNNPSAPVATRVRVCA